jgi:MFS family permease
MTSLNPDPLIVSLVQVATNLPLFVLALPAGALVDMVDRRRFLIISELAVMIAGIVLAVLVSSHLITPVGLLVMTALVSAAGALGAPAWQAVVTQLVPKSELSSAIAMNALGINISRAIGPAIGGLLVSLVGFGPPFWIDALSNAGVIAGLTWWKPSPHSGPSLPPERFASALAVGLRHARNNPHLIATLIRTGAFFTFASAYWALLPVLTRSQVSGGPALYGSLLAAIGAGAIVGAFALPRLKRRWGADRLMTYSALGTVGATILFALSRQGAAALGASVLAGVCWIGAVSTLTLSAQVALPEWVRGRGLAIFVTVMFGGLSLGALVWGSLAGVVGVAGALLLAAAGGLLVIPFTRRWALQTGAKVDFTPALHWPTPVTTHQVAEDRGPVLVTVEYHIDPANRRPFLTALFRYSHERRRDGAYEWKVFEDPAADGRFVEIFLTDSWLEHLRHHARVTKSDRAHEEALQRYLAGGTLVTTHFIQVHQGDLQ